MKEIIKHKCYVTPGGAPFMSVMQYVYNFELKTPERVNHVCCFLPDEGDKKKPHLVAVFKVKNLKINQNGTNNN